MRSDGPSCAAAAAAAATATATAGVSGVAASAHRANWPGPYFSCQPGSSWRPEGGMRETEGEREEEVAYVRLSPDQ